ncbi:MAG: hypothetical protein IJ574_05470 [Bacilli bacterium]|nr:hypothetical protein [Bacilli bacterium]
MKVVKNEEVENDTKKYRGRKIVIFIILLIGFIYLGTIDYSKDANDNEKFSNEFNLVSKDNHFEYISASRVTTIMKKEQGIILFGFSGNEWTNYYASILNDVANELKIDKVYYYDIYNDRRSNNADYERVVANLSNELLSNDLSVQEIYAPSLLVVANNKILAYDDETSYRTGNIKPSDYWSEYQKDLKKKTLKVILQNYLDEIKH